MAHHQRILVSLGRSFYVVGRSWSLAGLDRYRASNSHSSAFAYPSLGIGCLSRVVSRGRQRCACLLALGRRDLRSGSSTLPAASGRQRDRLRVLSLQPLWDFLMLPILSPRPLAG